MHLQDYLDQAAQTPFAWGAHDCATFPAGWVLSQLGADPLAIWRDTYATAEEADGLIAEAGGLIALWTQAAEQVGASRTSAPRAGDVGVVELPLVGGARQLGAIRVNRAWAMLLADGVIVQPARCLAAWRI